MIQGECKLKVIGLTGNTGSGKSTVSKILYEEGAYIIDADKTGHKVMEPNEDAYFEIINYFGNKIVMENKHINRKQLGEIVFKDKEKLNILNEITHKYIVKKMEEELEKISLESNLYKCIVFDAPLLLDTILYKYTHKIWLVTADNITKVKRIMKRDDITEEQALCRIKSQKSDEELKKYADIIINNSNIDMQTLKKIIQESFYNFLKEELI